LFALLPAGRLSSHVKPALQLPPEQPIFALAASLRYNIVGRVRMTEPLTSTHRDLKHTQRICVALTTSGLMSSNRSSKYTQETKVLFV
jgi:hypothetical protein